MKLPSDNFVGRKAPIPRLESGLAGTGDCAGSEGDDDGVDGRKKGGDLRTFIVMKYLFIKNFFYLSEMRSGETNCVNGVNPDGRPGSDGVGTIIP